MSTTHENVINHLSEPGSPLALQMGLVDLILAQPQRITEQLSLETLAHRIRTDTVLAQWTADIRAALAEGGRKGRYKQMKEQMPAVVPAVAAPPGTATKGISARYHNGLYGFDIDEGRDEMDKQAVFDSLVEAPGSVLVGTSCAGGALYAFFAGPKAEDYKDYIRHWEAIARELPPSARAASSSASKNLNRLRFISYDPDLWVAEYVEPLAGARSVEPQTARPDYSPSGESAEYRDALEWVDPPDDYNDWFGWLPTLKALGFALEEVEEWSKRGQKYREGEVALRWDTLPEDDPNAARDKLLGFAHNRGWRRQNSTSISRAPVKGNSPRPTLSEGLLSSLQDDFLSNWQKLALVCADYLRPRFRYDRVRASWWAWNGDHWSEVGDDIALTDPLHSVRLRLAADLRDSGMEELARHLYMDRVWQSLAGNKRSEWWAKMRDTLARPAPSPPPNELPTPGGVVDLRTGGIETHDPLKHDTLGVTRGMYRPNEASNLRETLWRRLQFNIDRNDFDQLIKALGVAAARRSVDYGGILWLYGASGGGKGSTARLIQLAFGMQGIGVSADLLERRSRSDIDADLARLIQIDPVVYVASEIERVGSSRINSITGGDVLSARRPHGKIVEGALSGMLVVTSVDAPRVSVEKGLERRVIVISFPRKLDASVTRQRHFTRDELDAVITLAVQEALQIDQEGWEPPVGNREAKERFLADADPVSRWLEDLPDSYDGKTMKEALEEYNKQEEADITIVKFGRQVGLSQRWKSVLPGRGQPKVLKRRKSP